MKVVCYKKKGRQNGDPLTRLVVCYFCCRDSIYWIIAIILPFVSM